MSRILLAISERWIPDVRVDAIGDFVLRLGGSILAVHVAYGTEGSGADVTPGERLLDQSPRNSAPKTSRSTPFSSFPTTSAPPSSKPPRNTRPP